ncbi:peptidoglycan binding protein CsiV [Litorivicinus sp.]|nr:peptidoglycan binding protein CsiV [Litorivicinus sp.]
MMTRSLWISILMLSAAITQADTRPYALEVLVFSRAEPVHTITEAFPPEEPVAPESFDLLFALDSGYKNLRPVPVYSHALNNAATQILTQTGSRVLFHKRWIHPLTKNQNNNPWFQINGTGRLGETLRGYLRWSIDRYIELDVDLRLTKRDVRMSESGELLPEVYQIREFRKMSSKDIHYLDHPAFGVLIAAEPIVLTDQIQDAESALETPPQPLNQ